MAYILLMFGVFWIIDTAQRVFTLPPWAWVGLRIALSGGGVVVAIDKGHWYYLFAVAGGSLLIERTSDLLSIKRDEALSRTVRYR